MSIGESQAHQQTLCIPKTAPDGPWLGRMNYEWKWWGSYRSLWVCKLIHSLSLLKWSLSSFKLQKGLSSARANDIKGLKGAIPDWITPPGQSLNPPIARNIKMDCGFNHECTGSLLCSAGMDWTNPEQVFRKLANILFNISPHFSRIKEALKSGEMQIPGDQWPIFIYTQCEYDPDDAWKGTFRSMILVVVSEELTSNYFSANQCSMHSSRHTNMYLLHQVQLTRSAKWHDWVMHRFMVWQVWH